MIMRLLKSVFASRPKPNDLVMLEAGFNRSHKTAARVADAADVFGNLVRNDDAIHADDQ
jgi:hypothetical protein